MEIIPGIYEHTRDNDRSPACWRRRDNECFPHFHSALELVYVRGGAMEATLAGRHYSVAARELLVVPAYTVHLYASPGASETYVLIVPSDYSSAFQKALAGRTFSPQVLADDGDTREISRCMKELMGRRAAGSVAGRGYLYVILGILLERVPLVDTARQAKSGQIQRILEYLHRNSRSPLTLGRIATEFGYSDSRFSHIFNENVGCSLSHYLNTLRCRDAAALLLERDLSVLDAAMAAGFESMRTFYRSFRRCFGVTPSQYLEFAAAGNREPGRYKPDAGRPPAGAQGD